MGDSGFPLSNLIYNYCACVCAIRVSKDKLLFPNTLLSSPPTNREKLAHTHTPYTIVLTTSLRFIYYKLSSQNMWGWFSKKGDQEENTESPQLSQKTTNNNSNDKSEYLEDLKPKFEDENISEQKKRSKRQEQLEEVVGEQSKFQLALQTIRLNDLVQLHTIPCFGRAIGIGTSIAGVTFGVMKFMRKNENRSKLLNWTMLGFLLGSVISWEQCRHQLRQQQKISNNKVVKTEE